MPSFDPLSRLTDMIGRNGFALQFVFPDIEQGISSFAYTVGLHAATGYELALSGLAADQSQRILRTSIDRLRDQRQTPTAGMDLDQVLAGGMLLRLRPVHQLERLVTLHDLYDEIPPVWQAMWPDPQGHFPDEAGYSLSPSAQPFL